MIGSLLFTVLQIYQLILLGRVLLSYFPNLDRSNPIIQLLYDVTEPVLRPVRQMLPQNTPFDLSPLVVFFAIWFLMQIVRIVF